MSLQKLQRKILPCFFQVLMAIGIPWLPWLVTTITPLSVSIFMSPSPLYVCVFSSSIAYKDIYHWNQGSPRYSRMISSQDNYLHLQRAFFQIRSHSLVQNGGHHSTDYTYYSWRRQLRGHKCQLTHKLDPGNWRLLTPSPLLGMYLLPTNTTVGAGFKDTPLRELDDVKTIWTGYMTEPRQSLCITL